MTSARSSPQPRRPTRPFVRAAPPALIAAACAIVGRDRPALVLLAVAIVLAHVEVAAPQLLRHLDSAAGAIGRAAAAVVVGVAGAVIVTPIWLLQRVVRFDPLVDPRARGRWRPVAVEVRPGAGRGRRPYGPELGSTPRRRLHGQFALIAPLLVAMAVLAASVALRARHDHRTEREAQALFTSVGEPFGPELLAQFRNSALLYDPATGDRPADQADTYVHVRDRVRRSFVPSGAPEATVWFFGGSTMFGLGQRDEHTIPSDVARLAAAKGLTLRVVNYGVLGYVNWQEMLLFSLLLSQGHRPDLAVFYDGCNELALSVDRVTKGEPAPIGPRFLNSAEIERSRDPSNRLVPRAAEPGPAVPEPRRLATATTRGADQFRQGADLITRLSDSYHVPVTFVWQPTLATKTVGPPDQVTLDHQSDPPWGGWNRADARALQAGILRRSGVHAIDLTDALDGYPIPAYLDECHTTERAALQISESLYDRLQPILRADRPKGG